VIAEDDGSTDATPGKRIHAAPVVVALA